MKRVVDLLGGVLALMLAAPVLIVVAAAIRAFDGAPVLYSQTRVGRGGREFRIVKFRSMITNADQTGGYSTSVGDPRVTRIGAFIRRSSLDELPQLLNVLRGEMSLVGPRPDVPQQRTLYSESEWAERHSVRPGLTGLAQATLRSAASDAERKQLDLEYVRHRSLSLDLRILLLTVKQVLTKGSY